MCGTGYLKMDYGSRTLPTPSRLRRSHSASDRATGIPKIPTRFGMAQQVFNKAMSYNNTRSIVEDHDDQKKDNNNNDDNSKLKRTVIVIKGRKRLESAPPESNNIRETSEGYPNKNQDGNRKSHHKFNNGNITSSRERIAIRKRLSTTTTVLDPFINDQDTFEERIQVNLFDFEFFEVTYLSYT